LRKPLFAALLARYGEEAKNGHLHGDRHLWISNHLETSMDLEDEIYSLTGETLAFNAVLVGVLARLARDPKLKAAIAAGLSDAADTVEQATLMMGKTAPPLHIAKFIVKELRAGVLGREDGPTADPA
jgi:hypothetical protein